MSETQSSGLESARIASTLEAATLPAAAERESGSKEAAAAAEPPPQQQQQKLGDLVGEVESPQPIRLPTKSKSKPADSDSDSDSKSTKSSASSSSKVARSFKKTFKGKAIAIVKPFSNPAPEKKSPESKPVDPSTRSEVTDEYEFGVEGEEEAGGTLEEGSSRRKEGVKPVRRHFHRYQIIIIIIDIDIDTVEIIISFHQVKRLKGGRQLKSVRVRVEKLQGKRQVMTMTMTMKGCPTLFGKNKSQSLFPFSATQWWDIY